MTGPRGWGFCVPEAQGWVRGALARGERLRDAAARTPDRLELMGRGVVHAPAAPGGGRWVVRPYRRGGLVAGPLLRDRYLSAGTPRPLAEALASEEVRRRGIATPRVLAGAVYPAGPFYRADLVTEYIPGARDLAALLFGPAEGEVPPRPLLLSEAGGLVRSAAVAGVAHPDLNARNILIVPKGATALALLLDLDRCRVHRSRPPALLEAMLGRLERSLRKLGGRSGHPLAEPEWAALRRAAFAPLSGDRWAPPPPHPPR